MYGLDLFSGIGGITKALEGYVQPVAYCENDRYAQAVLLSRMSTGELPVAPIYDDVTTIMGRGLEGIDVIYGGFPCQDISVAGRGAGLGGERSGLFFEIVRLIGEIRPRFVFLENVSAITIRGAERVIGEFCRLRYDCRWGILSASDVGANHRRERWWLLAHANDGPGRTEQGEQQEIGAKVFGRGGKIREPYVANASRDGRGEIGSREFTAPSKTVADSESAKCQFSSNTWPRRTRSTNGRKNVSDAASDPRRECDGDGKTNGDWWTIEPNVGRVAHGVPFRVDRLRGLGNAVVPAQAREAFERLMGLK